MKKLLLLLFIGVLLIGCSKKDSSTTEDIRSALEYLKERDTIVPQLTDKMSKFYVERIIDLERKVQELQDYLNVVEYTEPAEPEKTYLIPKIQN